MNIFVFINSDNIYINKQFIIIIEKFLIQVTVTLDQKDIISIIFIFNIFNRL